MELKELKCKNCGAKIEINEKDTLATCKYCNTSFSINECDNHNSESKKTSISEKQEKQMKTILKFMFFNPFTILFDIIFVLAFIIIFGILIKMFMGAFNWWFLFNFIRKGVVKWMLY